jgi:lipid II:glycine glycyltransferase (peptidoglycan interpeptide bridge formation enzyme)
MPAVFDRYVAHVIDLENQPADRLLDAMRPKTRQYIRKAERDGIHVESDESPASFQAYYRLFLASSRRWGRAHPGKPWALFDAIQRRCRGGDVRLWMARVGDEPAAGLVCFYGKGEVFAWSAALDERHVATRANYLLHWRAIADAATREFSIFNLGSNEGMEGVRWFKEGLGTRRREYPAYVVAGRAYSAALWAWRTSRSAVAALRSLKGRKP